MINQRTTFITIGGAALVVISALIIAWGVDIYYGQRTMGQDLLLPENQEIISYSNFEWPLEDESELIFDDTSLADPQFAENSFKFTSVEDTYLYFNLDGNELIADYHYLMTLKLRCKSKEAWFYIMLFQGHHEERQYFMSEKVALDKGRNVVEVDLSRLKFRNLENEEEALRWGKDIKTATGLRLDFDAKDEATEYSLRGATIYSGVTFNKKMADIASRCEVDGLSLAADGGVEFNGGGNSGTITTHAIGVGYLNRYVSLETDSSGLKISVEARTGLPQNSAREIGWKDWVSIADPNDLSDISGNGYIQFRFTLEPTDEADPQLRDFTLRLLDRSPPGLSGPLFGTGMLDTIDSSSNLNRLLANSGESTWARVLMDGQGVPELVDLLTARNVSLIGSLNLDKMEFADIEQAVARYSDRIHAWELISTRGNHPGSYYLELVKATKAADPLAIVFPRRIDSDYFQSLALDGMRGTVGAMGSTEEVLNRGFWWYFVLALIGILFVLALGPVVGYNFNFGVAEIRHTLIALALSAVIIIPLMVFSGFASLTLPRDLPQLQIAFGRFVFSSFLQEFLLRAIFILLPVKYMIRAGLEEKRAWLIAILGSSLLFGLTHLGYPGLSSFEILIFILITTAAGCILGWLFYKNRSLTAVWLAHLLFNIFMSTMTTIGGRI